MARLVVIGGVAAGMSAASQAKRRRPDLEVVVLERGPYVSYGACGIPYNLQDPARPIEDLVVMGPETFRRERGIEVRTGHEVVRLDLDRRTVAVRDLATGAIDDLRYDALVLATGAAAVRPPIPGIDEPGVFAVRTLADGAALKRFLQEARPSRAVVIGAGYVGLELAEALRARGLAVTVLERAPQAAPGFAAPVERRIRECLGRHDVTLETGVAVGRIARLADGRLRVETDRGAFPADLAIVAVGVRPEVALARAAGLRIGETGALAVDAGMATGAPGVWAAGDLVEVPHLVAEKPAWIPLGTTANKTGKVAGANAAGGTERFAGVVGTAGFKLFDLEVARTGLSLEEARRHGLDAIEAVSVHRSRGHGYPGAKPIVTVVVAERGAGRLLGAQMAGGDTVAKRIDVLATALHARMTVADVAALDLAYAPPFAPVWDPVLVAASVAVKELEKRA